MLSLLLKAERLSINRLLFILSLKIKLQYNCKQITVAYYQNVTKLGIDNDTLLDATTPQN